MTRPRILVVPHVRELDTVLGPLRASILYDRYCERIVSAGGQPLTVWQGSPDVDDLVGLADGILLIGGGDVAPERFGMRDEGEAVDRVRDDFEARLVLGARREHVPLLGVCRGAQILNVALGGTLRRVEGHRQPDDLGRPSHRIELVSGTRIAEIACAGRLEVNSFHNWAPDALGDGLLVSAVSGDVAEAVEARGNWWALGVQWHAELLEDASSQRLFDALPATADTSRS